mgnify:CR=1 FL=1
MILGITGMPGSGKGEVIKILENEGFLKVSMGDVIREEVKKRGIEQTPENFGKIMKEIREKYGEEIVAKKCAEKIEKHRERNIVIDGIRSLAECEFFKRTVKKLKIVAVHASPETRYKRLVERGREDDPKDWKTFYKRDMRELSVGIGEVIALSDVMIVNEGTIGELEREVKEKIRWLNEKL